MPQAYNITDFYYYGKVNFSKPIVKEKEPNARFKPDVLKKSKTKLVIF